MAGFFDIATGLFNDVPNIVNDRALAWHEPKLPVLPPSAYSVPLTIIISVTNGCRRYMKFWRSCSTAAVLQMLDAGMAHRPF